MAVDGAHITWGTLCGGTECDVMIRGSLDTGNAPWGTSCNNASCDRVVWGDSTGGDAANIVWGTACAGADCPTAIWHPAARASDKRRGPRGDKPSVEPSGDKPSGGNVQ
jgi:hypothetical protein